MVTGSRPRSSPGRGTRRVPGVVLVAAALVLGACSAQRASLARPDRARPATTTTTTTVATSVPATSPGTPTLPPTTPAPATPVGPSPNGPANRQAALSDLRGFIATPAGEPDVHTAPDAASPRIPIEKINALGVPTVLAVVGGPDTVWLQVLLPTRPNGRTGWTSRASVRVTATDLRLFVDLEARRLTAKRGNQIMLEVPVAVGTPDNPTPTGATYVTELLDTGSPNGAYGPFAYGLALHSNTLSEFAGGDGQVGLHGTNAPALIGQRVSHGCVRMANENVRKLVNLQLPLGTPVFIT